MLPLNMRNFSDFDFGSGDKVFLGNKMEKQTVQKKWFFQSLDLKWTDDLEAACRKAVSVLFLLKRSSPLLLIPANLNLLTARIISVLIYGNTCWYANIDSFEVIGKGPEVISEVGLLGRE